VTSTITNDEEIKITLEKLKGNKILGLWVKQEVNTANVLAIPLIMFIE